MRKTEVILLILIVVFGAIAVFSVIIYFSLNNQVKTLVEDSIKFDRNVKALISGYDDLAGRIQILETVNNKNEQSDDIIWN